MIGELLPDQPALDNPGVLQARNVIPYANAYRPARDFVANTDPLGDYCRGADVIQAPNGAVFNYAADTTDVYNRSGNSWTSISPGFSLNQKERWEFTRQFDTVIAVNGTDKVLTGTPGQVLNPTLAGPQARHVTTVKNHVIVGNLISGAPNSGGSDGGGIMWSALGLPDEWDTANGAGYTHLDISGSVTKLFGGEYISIFTEAGIWRGNYLGDPDIVWEFDYVVPNKPAPYSGAIVQVGFNIYFLSQDGFYVFNGGSATPISSDKLSKTFFEDFDIEAAWLMTSIADLENNLIYFAYPGAGHSPTSCNRIMIFNYVTGMWTGPIEQETEQLLYGVNAGTLLDDYPGPSNDNLVDPPGIYAGVSVDDPRFLGGADPTVSAFIPTHEHAVPLGNVKTALIETGEYQHNPGGYTYAHGMRPYVDGADPVVCAGIGYRNTTSETVTRLPCKPINPRTGSVDYRIAARYHRYTVEVYGDYDSISGGVPLIEIKGRR